MSIQAELFKLNNELVGLRFQLSSYGYWTCNGWRVSPSKWEIVDGKNGILKKIFQLEEKITQLEANQVL